MEPDFALDDRVRFTNPLTVDGQPADVLDGTIAAEPEEMEGNAGYIYTVNLDNGGRIRVEGQYLVKI